MLQKGLNFSLYKKDYLLHDSHQEIRTFNGSLVLGIIFYFQHMQFSFLDAFVVKSDILELLNNTFVLKFKHMQWSFLPKSKN